MIRVTRVVTAAAAVLALAAATPGLAYAQPSAAASEGRGGAADGSLPEGWRITGTGAGRQLVWTADRRVPMGDARVEFHTGDRLIGVPAPGPDGRSFSLPIAGARLGDGQDLRVLAAGRRLDAAGAREARTPDDAPAAGLTGAALPANAVDPGKPGSYRTATGEYALKSVKLPGFAAPVEMRAVVVGPVNAPGTRPLALFLHGRHYTCYGGGQQTGDWPCKPGTQPVPSHRGYLGAQKLLASQGYTTLSISANGINGQDWNAEDGGAQARSSLVRLHLARWAEWAAKRSEAPKAVRDVAPADLDRVMLVGHSRGGEGVNRAALDSLYTAPADRDGYRGPVRWKIRGNVLIGPTIFGQNPVPDVPSATILPGCDGDVSDLQGQIYADGTRGLSRGAALHSSVYVVGANHNFFNSEWTPGQSKAPSEDDFWPGDNPDPVCGVGKKTRLTATQQQAAGATYIAAAARLFVAGDDRVRPLLDGTGRRAPSADPARVLTHAVGGNRTTAVLPGSTVKVSGTGARTCAQVSPDPAKTCLPGESGGQSPHFAGWEASPEPGRDAVALRWTAPGTAAVLRPAAPVSLKGSESLALRLIVPPNTTGTLLDVSVTDASGRRAKLGQVRADGLPGTERTASYWARELRVPLTAATGAGLDLTKVATLELTPRSRAGKAWLMDAWGWRPGTPAVRAEKLVRVDVGRLEVKEGDAGTKTYRVPVSVTGQGTGRVRLFVPNAEGDKVTSKLVTVRPGRNDIDVPFAVTGNTRFGRDTNQDIFVKAVRGTVVGAHRGGVTAKNDDPMPKVKVTAVDDDVTEGQALTWRVSLSEKADADIMGEFALLPVTRGAELSTADVERRWLEEWMGHVPDPARPLSQAFEQPALYVQIPAGKLSTLVTVPTVKDRLTEPKEFLRAQLRTYDADWMPQPGPEVTGTVRNAS
ncbi:hypothetical protein ACIQUQ_16490 [Streptomyces sp. NPDC101118]|uniref:hypothetical protein n=1 Tax=Streptomyces sp. NPDC101118 TaxID=3366109 RepID=UPI0037FEB53A